MSRNASLETLFYPFAQGEIAYPPGRTLFVNAQPHPALEQFPALDCLQDFFPDAQGLKSLISEPVPAAAYDAALVLIPKDKTRAQADLALGVLSLKQGGMIVVCAANDANGSRLDDWFAELGLAVQVMTKNKCRVVRAQKGDETPCAQKWLRAGDMRQVDMNGDIYWSRPGLFGWNKIDEGSRLLAQHLPRGLTGKGADFGCGYGYLARRVCEKNPQVALTALDADRVAVDCCVRNNPGVTGIWADLTGPWSGEAFDWIVMNPPFHAGKTTDAAIGLAFIDTAASALKKGGMLYMVANRQLPYEKVLREYFSKVEIVTQDKGFKIIYATR